MDITNHKRNEARVKRAESRWMLTQQLTHSGSVEKDIVKNITMNCFMTRF